MKIMSIVGCLCFCGQELGTLNISISKDDIIPWSKVQDYTVWYAWMCLSKHDTDYMYLNLFHMKIVYTILQFCLKCLIYVYRYDTIVMSAIIWFLFY